LAVNAWLEDTCWCTFWPAVLYTSMSINTVRLVTLVTEAVMVTVDPAATEAGAVARVVKPLAALAGRVV
jgi:hypothetical protein